MKSLIKIVSLVLLIISIQACSSKREILKGRDWANDHTAIVSETEKVVLIADTQIHESRGTASRWFSLASDEFIPVTIRSGQQVIGTIDVLTEVLNQTEENQLVLHLGDALDVSCQTEWEAFKDILKPHNSSAHRNPIIFTPGNHDGFLVGNFYPFKDDWLYKSYYWDNVCNAGRAFESDKLVFTSARKEDIIEDYIALLDPIPQNVQKDNIESRCVISNARKLCYSKYINKEAPWESYIIQLLQIATVGSQHQKFYALFLDTSDFHLQPWPFGTKAGVSAGISVRQLEAAKEMLRDHLPKNAKYFVAGHHDFTSWKAQSWTSKSQALLDEILLGPQSLRFLITAHTHEGGWYGHNLNGGDLTELNLGSLIDYPVYYRDLKFVELDNGSVGIESNLNYIDTEDIKNKETCSPFNSYLPSTREGYSVKDQETENERLSNYPRPIKFVISSLSAIGHFFKFWKSKHTELKPQLLSYRDIVQVTMPYKGSIHYHPLGKEQSAETSLNKQQIIKTLESLAPCDTGKVNCSVQEKAHILLALDRYYSKEAPKEIHDRAHLMKFCLALHASSDAAKTYFVTVNEIKSRAMPTKMLLVLP